MKLLIRFGLSILLLALMSIRPALAFDYPLSSSAIREAYFLGKTSEAKREDFLAKYTQRPPAPRSGPYVSTVRLETPYAVIVDRTAHTLANYSAPDAQKEFLGKPGIFRLHVRIELTASYSWQLPSATGGVRLRPDDFWKDFKVRLIQNESSAPLRVDGAPIYSFAAPGSSSALQGADVYLDYDAERIRSAPVAVEVETPDRQTVKVTFDLSALR